MGKTLFICEKHSQAEMVAKAYKYTRKNNYFEIHACDEFPSGAYVAYAAGHLLSIKKPSLIDKKWESWSLETLPINPPLLEKNVDSKKRQLLQTIKQLEKHSRLIVNAGDIDIEGSYLVHEIILYLGIKKPLKRLWLTSLTPGSVRKAVKNMKDFSKTSYMYWQGLARSEADWLYGMNFSRQFTLLLNNHPQLKGKMFPVNNKKTSNVFSVGRVQTVVNYLIYQRELAIENFVSEPFWNIYADILVEDIKYRGKWFIPDVEHLFYKEQAEFLVNEISGKPTEIIEKNTEEKEIPPPRFFNLTTLQKAVDKKIGLSPDRTLDELQKLYLAGYVSYPRTDIVYVGKGEAETFPTILSNLAALDEYKDLLPAPIQDISNNTRYVNPPKVQEHYGIIPTEEKVDLGELNDNQKVIYDMIAKSVIAAHYPNAKVKEEDIITLINQQYTFRSKGKKIVDPGWYDVFPSNNNDDILPPLEIGDKGKHIHSEIVEGETKPLSRWSEADIVVMMANAYRELSKDVRSNYSTDELALGTVATRAETVKTLKTRGYIQVKKNKVYITAKGRILALSMKNINLFTSPISTGNMQKHLNEEIKNEETYQHFIQGIRNRVKLIVSEVMKRHKEWDFSDVNLSELPEDKAKHEIASTKPIGVCLLCNSLVIDKGELYACQDERKCKFKLWKTQFGREIELVHAQSILAKGTSPLLKFFSKAKNKPYKAWLIWDKEQKKINLRFPERNS